jgi:uncharacterized membrane protein YuzA (DUF378 family)
MHLAYCAFAALRIWLLARLAYRAFGVSRVWHIARLAYRVFGISRVWHIACLAYCVFGISRVWHMPRLAYCALGVSCVWHITHLAYRACGILRVWRIAWLAYCAFGMTFCLEAVSTVTVSNVMAGSHCVLFWLLLLAAGRSCVMEFMVSPSFECLVLFHMVSMTLQEVAASFLAAFACCWTILWCGVSGFSNMGVLGFRCLLAHFVHFG